jgi:C4-dicarboxylate transporter DctM subunit
MDIVTIAIVCIIAIVFLMMMGVPLPYTVGSCAVIGTLLALGGAGASKAGLIAYQQFFHLQWTPLALFVFLACIISETRLGSDVFEAANNWLSRLPGGLVVASIMAEAGMAATIGSSTATALAVGKVAVPQMERLGYNKEFSLGALLTGGTLGPLIPPSVPFIVYALLAQESIGQLFIAGVIPGIILAIMLSGYAFIACSIRPELAPRPAAVTWKERMVSLGKVWPVLVVILGVLGGVYLGIMTATEAAGVAVVIVLVLSVVFYRFRLANLVRAMIESAILNGMVCLMIVAVVMFTYILGSSGLSKQLANFLITSGLSPWLLVVSINIVLLILGCFVDGLAIIMLTVPLFVPLIRGLGFSLVWFGVIMVVNIEIGLITPPMGLNLFVMREAFNIPIGKLIRAVVPFLIVLLLFLAIIIAFPPLSTWLPGMMKGR